MEINLEMQLRTHKRIKDKEADGTGCEDHSKDSFCFLFHCFTCFFLNSIWGMRQVFKYFLQDKE